MLPLIVLASQAEIAATPAPPNNQIIILRETPAPITVTASRNMIRLAETGISISQITLPQIEALSLPLVKDYLTLIPGVAGVSARTGRLAAPCANSAGDTASITVAASICIVIFTASSTRCDSCLQLPS